jgi:hypothetical protein
VKIKIPSMMISLQRDIEVRMSEYVVLDCSLARFIEPSSEVDSGYVREWKFFSVSRYRRGWKQDS